VGARPFSQTAAVLALALVAGCSGSGAGLPASPAQSQSGSHKTAKVTFTMHWDSTTTSSAKVHRAYVPSTALSVSVAVNGGTPQYLNAPLTTLTIDAPVGTDTFAFATYDQPSGQGVVLSQADVTQAIVDGSANVVTAVLDGVIASLALSLSNASPNAGTPATVAVQVAAKDADGNTIIGSSNYSSSIVLSISDPANSGTLSLSANSIVSPAGTANLVYNGGTLWSATVTADTNAGGVPPVSVTFAPAPTFYYFNLPTSNSVPLYIAAGKDGNMWFTEYANNKIGKITPSGAITEYAIPTASSQPWGIVQGSDGRIWFAEYNKSKLGAVTTSGTFSEYATADYPNDTPYLLTDRGDGTMWYTSSSVNRVGYVVEKTGATSDLVIPTGNSVPTALAEGIDGNLYFDESNADKFGYLASSLGSITEFSLPHANTYVSQMVRGPDGQIWFTESGNYSSDTGKIDALNTTGTPYIAAAYQTVSPNSYPSGITVGADGALWFTENGVDAIGRVTTDGTVTEYKSPVSGLDLYGIAASPNGSLWFCEAEVDRIGELVY
jgi:virginiamycin B lyase